MTVPDSPLTLQQSLDALQAITSKLENPALPLEEALQLYAEGAKLAAYSEQLLKDAEQKIEAIQFPVSQ